MKERRMESFARLLVNDRVFEMFSALGAFALWGGWAYYVNQRASFHEGLVAGLAQGASSLVFTIFMIRLVGWFSARVERRAQSRAVMIILPALLTISLTGSILTMVHLLARTPNLLATIAPVIMVSLAYALLTSYKFDLPRRMAPQQEKLAGNE